MKKKLIRRGAIVLALVIALTAFAGCNKNKGSSDAAATVNGLAVTRPIFVYGFNFAANEVYSDSDSLLSFDKYGTQEFYQLVTDTKDPDGKTYYSVLSESTLNYAQKYLISESLAREAGDWPSDSELKASGEAAKSSIESSYSYYISYYGMTANDICLQVYGMPLEDYMEFYPRSAATAEYEAKVMAEYTPADGELEAFYNEHTSEYRIVTVRQSLVLTQDMDETEKAEALKLAQSYVDAFKAGTMTYDEIVALSEDTGLASNNGYYDVVADGSYVKPFEDWAVSQTAISTEPEIVETTYGYHIMMCTGITGYEDDTVKQNVEDGWRQAKYEDMIDGLADEGKYAIKNRNAKVIERYMKMLCTMNFDDPDATDAPAATATPKPEYNDAAQNTDVIATVKGENVLYPEFVYFFNTAIMEIVGNNITFDQDATTAERYTALRAFLATEYEDTGKTYLKATTDRAEELMLEFRASYLMARAEKEAYTEEKLTEMNDNIDSMIDQYVSMYGEYYGVSTRDEYVNYVMGMGVNDYKYFNAIQSFVSEYAEEKMNAYNPTEEEQKAFYTENESDYRVVTVYHILLNYSLDDSGSATDEEKAAKLAQAEALVQKLKDGDAPEALAKAWSVADDAETGGLVDLTAVSTAYSDEIMEWVLANTTTGLDTLKIFETETGVEIMYVNGILTFDGLEGTTASTDVTLDALKTEVLAAMRNEYFEGLIKAYIADNSLTLDNLNEDLVNKAVEAYLTVDVDEEESAE